MADIDWTLPRKGVHECEPCELCGEPWCAECGLHYSECRHPGPHTEAPTEPDPRRTEIIPPEHESGN